MLCENGEEGRKKSSIGHCRRLTPWGMHSIRSFHFLIILVVNCVTVVVHYSHSGQRDQVVHEDSSECGILHGSYGIIIIILCITVSEWWEWSIDYFLKGIICNCSQLSVSGRDEMELMAERESVYRLLAQVTKDNMHKNMTKVSPHHYTYTFLKTLFTPWY